MALAAAGRFVVAGSSALECGAAGAVVGSERQAERIVISARRSCIPLRFSVAQRAGVQPRALATNYLEEESNIAEVEEGVDEVVEEEEVNPLTPSAFEVRMSDYLFLVGAIIWRCSYPL
jgi:hypothetical protein